MAEGKASAHSTEKTFRAYTNDDGAAYAEHRRGYHPNLFKRIVDYHVSHGGKLDTVVDVGCGPGIATKFIAPFFQNAIGIDPSEGMIVNAKKKGGVSGNGQPIRYEISTAEDLDIGQEIIANGTVDMITAATAAHWFDMTKFWPRAAQLLRPGGTVAIWTGNFNKCHPTTPNAEKMNKALNELEEKEVGPFMEPGNIIGRELYTSLPLPWTLTPTPISDFDETTFFRKEWGTPGNDDAEAEGQEFFQNGQTMVTLDMVELAIATASPIARWRQANPDKVGTDGDIVKQYRRIIEHYLHEAGVPKGEELVKGSVSGVLLMIKKKKA